MIFDATRALYDLNEKRAKFEQRREEGLVDPDELGPIALTASETLVAGYMARRANDNTAEVWSSLDTMAAACRINRSTVKRALPALCKKGIIERTRKGGGHSSVTYRFILGVPPSILESGSSKVTVNPLDTVVDESSRVTDDFQKGHTGFQQGHGDPLYKIQTSKETKVPRSRASSSQVSESDAALMTFYVNPSPRDTSTLPALARALISEMNETTVGHLSDFERLSALRRIAKSGATPRMVRATAPVDDLEDRDAALAAELAAEIADARSRQATVERKNSEVPV